jgi:hypothetical protein
MDLTVVVVSSPSWANPELGMLPAVLESLHHITGVESCSGGVVIVLDGYIVSNNEQVSFHMRLGTRTERAGLKCKEAHIRSYV